MNKVLLLLVSVAFTGCTASAGEDAQATDVALTTSTRLVCESIGHRYNTCDVHAPIRHARIVRQLSSAPCDLGQSWGYSSDYVWVDCGCRAEFDVVVDTGPPPPACGALRSGQSLYQGQTLPSCNGRAYLAHQTDGNIVLYAQGGRVLVATNVFDGSSSVLTMQSDGNLVEYSRSGRPIWASDTAGYYGAELYVQDDCNAVLYQNGRPIWASNTDGCRPPH